MTAPRMLTHNGETHSLSEWDRVLGWKTGALKSRLRRGMTMEEAITTPKPTNNSGGPPLPKALPLNPDLMAMEGRITAEEYIAITNLMANDAL